MTLAGNSMNFEVIFMRFFSRLIVIIMSTWKARRVIAGNLDKEFAELYHNERLCRQWKPQINVRIKRPAETGAIPFEWGSMSFRRARLIKPRNYSVQKLFSGSQVNTYVRFNEWILQYLTCGGVVQVHQEQ